MGMCQVPCDPVSSDCTSIIILPCSMGIAREGEVCILGRSGRQILRSRSGRIIEPDLSRTQNAIRTRITGYNQCWRKVITERGYQMFRCRP
jgi:hypothetical protein